MDTLNRFAELITEQTGFEPKRRSGLLTLPRKKVCRLLEIPCLPHRTEIKYFPTRESLMIPLSEVLHYMQTSLTDRQLGDLFWLERNRIFGDTVFIAWRNVNYLWYLRRLNRIPRGLPVQVRILDELIRTVFEPRNLRGISEFDLSQCIDGCTFRPDYYIPGLTRQLLIEIDEDHHDRGATSTRETLVDREKQLLGQTHFFKLITIRVRDWQNRYLKEHIIRELNRFIDEHHLNEFFDAFREFNRISFEALTSAFGLDVMNRLLETNFGCVIPWEEAVAAMRVDHEMTEAIEQLIVQKDTKKELDLSFDDDDDFDDDSDADIEDDNQMAGECHSSTTTILALNIDDHYRIVDGCIKLNLRGLMRMSATAQSPAALTILDAAGILMEFGFSRLNRFARVSLKPEEIKPATKAFARIPILKTERRLEAETFRADTYQRMYNELIEKHRLPEEPIELDPFAE